MKRLIEQLFLRKRHPRQGFVSVYVAGAIVVLLGVSALVIDLGIPYQLRSQYQKATDAAVLAGAAERLKLNKTTSDAQTMAKSYLTTNYGFSLTDPNTTITATATDITPMNGEVTVTISRPYQSLIAGIFAMRGRGFSKTAISTTATASYTLPVTDLPIDNNNYGQDLVGSNAPAYNFTMFGPHANYSYGDDRSVKYLDNGTVNPRYYAPDNTNSVGTAGNIQGGYNFIINTQNVTSNRIQVELYDPDTYNGNGSNDASTTSVDEIRDANPNMPTQNPAMVNKLTNTQYALYSDNGTPYDLNDDKLISRVDYRNDSTSDMKWVTPTGFTFDKVANVNGNPVNYRLNVVTTDGASENGFNVRAGPERSVGTSFSKTNGSTLAVRGTIPMNFNMNGTANVRLGYVPATAAGGKIRVTKFDTDVGAVSVNYTCDTLPGQTFSGTLNTGSGTTSYDDIPVPSSYTGGNWTANYTAGTNDTSTWSVTYQNAGDIRLIK